MESDIEQMNQDGKKVRTGQQHLENNSGMAHQIFLWLWDVNSEQLYKSRADGRIGNQGQTSGQLSRWIKIVTIATAVSGR